MTSARSTGHGGPVLVLGGASWNTLLYVEKLPGPAPCTVIPQRVLETAGSTGLGKAMALRALGYPVVLHAMRGQDAAGGSLRQLCEERGIDAVWDIDPQGTAHHVNLMDAHGQRMSLFVQGGSDTPTVEVERWRAPLARAKTVFLNIVPSSLPLLDLLAASSAKVWVDLHDYDGSNPYHAPFIAAADVLQLSDLALPDPWITLNSLAQGQRWVLCTRAERGAWAVDPQGLRYEVSTAPAKLVDSNGAGDSFCVGFWHALQQGLGPHDALCMAAAVAALSVECQALAPPHFVAAEVAARMEQVSVRVLN